MFMGLYPQNERLIYFILFYTYCEPQRRSIGVYTPCSYEREHDEVTLFSRFFFLPSIYFLFFASGLKRAVAFSRRG